MQGFMKEEKSICTSSYYQFSVFQYGQIIFIKILFLKFDSLKMQFYFAFQIMSVGKKTIIFRAGSGRVLLRAATSTEILEPTSRKLKDGKQRDGKGLRSVQGGGLWEGSGRVLRGPRTISGWILGMGFLGWVRYNKDLIFIIKHKS